MPRKFTVNFNFILGQHLLLISFHLQSIYSGSSSSQVNKKQSSFEIFLPEPKSGQCTTSKVLKHFVKSSLKQYFFTFLLALPALFPYCYSLYVFITTVSSFQESAIECFNSYPWAIIFQPNKSGKIVSYFSQLHTNKATYNKIYEQYFEDNHRS